MLLGMRAWPAPDLPSLPVHGPEVTAYDTAAGEVRPLVPADGTARLYVCGITPYDATHLGHAHTYLAFDLLNRAWRNAGHDVRYAQNVTDVDDPLLERADRDGIDWRELAARETDLFRVDMTALRMLPPDYFVGVAESVDRIGEAVGQLVETGAAYRVDDDVYYDISSAPAFGQVSHLDQAAMRPVFAERGGDPDRPGKRNPLDALLWRAERPGEPSWPSPVGPGRPGWHIECTVIAREHLGPEFDVQGGGSDLVFPHHEMSAAHLETGRPGERFAKAYLHAGMVAFDGEKMSKSRGNLVFVSRLREQDVHPMAIRLALLSHHYRCDWEWTDRDLDRAVDRLTSWRAAASAGRGAASEPVVTEVLAALANDLDAPAALEAIDRWAARVNEAAPGGSDEAGAGLVVGRLADAALGVALG